MRLAYVRRFSALVLAGACLLASLVPRQTSAQQPAPGAGAASASEVPRTLTKELPLKRDAAGQAEGPPWIAFLVLMGVAVGAAAWVLRRRFR